MNEEIEVKTILEQMLEDLFMKQNQDETLINPVAGPQYIVQ